MTISDEELEFESALENPELLAAANNAVQQDSPPELTLPLDGPVTLPGGFRRIKDNDFEEVTTAWVRELDGADEERISKARLKNDPAAWINTLLECGVEKLGDEKPTKDDLKSLLGGDRDFLLLEISRATYGDDLEYEDIACYHCDRTMTFTVHKGEDIPVRRLESIRDSDFEVPLRYGRVAVVHLPTGEDQEEMSKATTIAETNSILLSSCVTEIRGPKGTVDVTQDPDAVRKGFGIVDRQKIIDEMSKRMPGPQYNEIRFEHPDCGKEVRLTVTLSDLFLGL